VAAAAGLEEQYAYLEESLRRFPTGPEQEELAREAGFASARHWPVAFGLMGRLDLVAGGIEWPKGLADPQDSPR
jgi:demethylmenaquinone methyltransferase/2-methoxy-6-polyprenyl-1,4-benzoquinol methylase